MKKTLTVLAVITAAACLTLSAAGCAAKTRNLASLASNWYSDPDFKKIQPTFTEGNANFAPEKLVYTVKQTIESTNRTYSVDYGTGEYTTEFYAKKLNTEQLAAITDAEWKKDYDNALGSDGTLVVYYYKTVLSMPSVTYKYDEHSASFEDSVVTESYFLPVENYLSPVYTHKRAINAVPANLQANSLASCYEIVDREYETFYKADGSALKTLITDYAAADTDSQHSEYAVGKLNENDYSVFDMCYTDIIARSMRNMGFGLEQTVTMYTPGIEPRQYTFKSEGTALCDDEQQATAQRAELQALLKDNGLFKEGEITNDDGTVSPKNLGIVDITVNYMGGSFSGSAQKYWFAVDDDNLSRTLMVKTSVPLTYGLGQIDFVLSNIASLPNS